MSLVTKELKTVSAVKGPLLFVENAQDLPFYSIVEITQENGEKKTGQVLDVSKDKAVIQVLESTQGLNVPGTSVKLRDQAVRFGVSKDIVGRIFSGAGTPIDGLAPIVAEKRLDINGSPINPVSREKPDDFIQTGVSAIDGFNTLVRGQKLPIFSGSGLPANEMAGQILKQAKVRGQKEQFVVVFAAIGITQREASYFTKCFHETESSVVIFMNLASDSTIERLLTPRYALTAAEYLAYECDMQVLVIITDMTNYCEALREVGTAREEIPGRRGYPGYMYTDLAMLYERAGRVIGKKGSVTQIPILSMPDDDITHPIADLTGYITEGQIVLSRQLHRGGVFPPNDILPSLSRLMNNGIGKGKTREDHRALANQLYACYAEGRDIRRLVAIVGEDSLSDMDQRYLKFANEFEKQMINQGNENRSIEQTLDLGWKLLSIFPPEELKKVNKDLIDRYFSEIVKEGVATPFV